MTKISDLAPNTSPTEDFRFKKMLTTPGHLGVAQGFIKDFFGIEVPLAGIRIANGYDITLVRRAVHEGGRAVSIWCATALHGATNVLARDFRVAEVPDLSGSCLVETRFQRRDCAQARSGVCPGGR